MEQLRGRTALITGASRGIGMRIARTLAGRNVNVALVARSGEALEQLSSELMQVGVRAKPIAYDLSDLSRLDMLLDRAESAVGPIDILINNAGIDGVRLFTEESDTELEQMIRLDLVSPMLLSRKMVPRMLAQGSGHIINIASLAGKAYPAYCVSYASAKAGLIAFTHALRAELQDTGVRATVVVPGFVSDEGMFEKQMREHQLRVSPLLGTVRTEQVASAIIEALLSDKPELIVNPGPMRLLQALMQLAPSFGAWLQQRLGVVRMLRTVAVAKHEAQPQPPAMPRVQSVPPPV
jgi:short-subunit dehydrogenase